MGRDAFGAWVDTARWVAASSVLVTHAGIRMLPPVSDLPSVSPVHMAYAFLAGFDHQAVMVFFVLSGLLVGGAVVREVAATGQVAYGGYLLRRLVRLWLVLWPAFLLSAACISAALALGAVERGVLPADTGASMQGAVLLCNAAFLQTAGCPQFAGNGALWSLFNEFWYYILFPPLAVGLLSNRPPWQRILLVGLALASLAALTAMQFTGSPIGPYMLVWAAGAAAAALPRPLIRRPWIAATLFAAGSLAIRLLVRRSFAGSHPLMSAELDLLLALLFANLLLTLRHRPALRPPPWPRLQATLAGFSFSLYCTHLPVLTLYITLLAAASGGAWRAVAPGPAQWLAILGGLALSVTVAWAFARQTEARTAQVRGWMARTWPGLDAARP